MNVSKIAAKALDVIFENYAEKQQFKRLCFSDLIFTVKTIPVPKIRPHVGSYDHKDQCKGRGNGKNKGKGKDKGKGFCRNYDSKINYLFTVDYIAIKPIDVWN